MGFFRRLLTGVLGEFSYTPPVWAVRAGGARIVAVLVVLLAGGLLAWWVSAYLESRPKPPQVVATVVVPGVTPVVDGELRPLPLNVSFEVVADPRSGLETVNSVARLDLVGSELNDGIRLHPQLPGTWTWVTENQLRFEPLQDWPAGEAFEVHFGKDIFARDLKLAAKRAEFTTPEFAARLDELSFYQDPADRNLRKVVATLSFTHPVDADSLRSHLKLGMRQSDATVESKPVPYDYTLQFADHNRVAYVHTVPLEIPERETYMRLTLKAGLAPDTGPSRLEGEITQNVRVPDITTYFRVNNAFSLIARDSDDNPIQTVTLEFTDRVQTARLQERIVAYLLPRSVSIENRRYSNKDWRSPREVTPEVIAQAQPVAVRLNPVEHDAAQLHSFSLDLPEGHDLYLRVQEGLESDGGYVLSLPYDNVVRLPHYPREVVIAQDGAILPLTGSHKLTFVTRGLSAIKVDLGRLIDSEVNHLASQTSGDIKRPQFDNYLFNQSNITTSASRIIDLNPQHPKTAAYSHIDLSEFLSEGGYYFVRAYGWNRATNSAVSGPDERFVLITDLGLLVKSNADDTHDVFVHSIASGQPVAGATIELLGRNGIAIFRRSSELDGHVVFPSTRGFDDEKTPTVYVVRSGSDAVFMPYQRQARQLQYSRFDVGGDVVQARSAAAALRAQVFTERGLYRPGDTVHFGAIVKRQDWLPVDRVPLIFNIVDARGQTVMDKRMSLPAGGFVEQSFATQSFSPTGNYNATVYLVERNNRRRSLGNTAFRVEEFQPDRLRIRSRISGQKPTGWIKPDKLYAHITLENLFGTPAQQRRVVGEYQLMPSDINIRSFSDYTFTDPLRDRRSPIQIITQSLPATLTDERGEARQALELGQYDNGIYRLSVLSEGFDQGDGRSVKARASVMLSPLDYLVGYKTDGDTSFIRKNAKRSVHFQAVDSDAEPTAVGELTLHIVEQRFVSSLVKRQNGTFAYQSIRKDRPISTQALPLADNGASFELPTDTAGHFVAKIVDANGLVYSAVPFVVAGARNLAGNLEKNAELELTLNGTSFSAGDYIEMEITAPYTGAGLISIERDSVKAYKWFRTDTTTTVQAIRIPDELEGNAYVNVSFIRDINSPEIFVSPLSFAVEPFAINRAARTVDIELDVPALAKPGEDLEIAYTASRPSRIVIYAVDEGILQVANYTEPDPLSFFLRKMALQVATFQLADLILPEFEAYQRYAAPGGGDAAELLGRNLNPFKRKTDLPVVYWSGIVAAGPQRKTVTYSVPDYFNGQLRIMAVAVSDEAVGSVRTQATVRAPFVISPNVLTAVAPGDEFDVNVGLANAWEGSASQVRIALAAEPSQHLELIGSTSTELVIDEGSESRARFRVRAKDQLGAAHIQFVASSADEQSRLRATLSVRPSVPYVATMQAGVSDADPVKLEFERAMYDEFAEQSAGASASPLILADGMFDYLQAFPHACAEQIVSKVFPQIGFLDNSDYELDEASIRSQFDATVQKLRARQTSEGGFRFWVSSSEPAEFPSVYILHFFTDAVALGLTVPRDMLRSGVGFLHQLAAVEAVSLPDARLRAYTIYVLTRNGLVTTNYLTNLHEYLEREHRQSWRQDLTGAYLAASYQLLKQQDLAHELIGKYKMQAGDEMQSDFDTRLGRDAQYLYLLSRHFPSRLENVEPQSVQKLIEPVMQNRFNTLSAAYAIMALNAYSKAVFEAQGVARPEVSAMVDGDRRTLAGPAVFARTQVANAIEAVRVSGGDGRNLFHVLSQQGFDRNPPSDALAEGIEIHREYRNDTGATVTTASVGTELTVVLRVRSKGKPRTNVAVIDLLPGGFEVLTDTVRNQYEHWSADYRDVREDRVVIYGSFDSRMTEIRYRVKLTAAGNFVLPSAYAGSMYDRSLQARTAPGRFVVESLR